MRHLFDQALRFGIVGMINSLVGLAGIWTAMLWGVSPMYANAIGFGIGLAVSFVLNGRWTFRADNSGSRALTSNKALPRFLVAFAVAWPLNAAAVWIVISSAMVSPYIAQLAGIIVYSVIFFVLCRTWVFAEGETATRTISKVRRPVLLKWFCLIIWLSVAFGYLAWKSLDASVADVDFKYLWFAGKLWAEGTSPYGMQYYERAQSLFLDTNVPKWMVYPPSWYPLAKILALLPLAVAERLWGALSGIMIVVSGTLMLRTIWHLRESNQIWPFVAFATFLGMGSATALSLSLGQTTPLMLVGVALFLHGFVARSQVTLGAALVILMLKPNLGLPFLAFLLFWRSLWPAVVGAGAVSTLSALMALLPYDPVTVIREYTQLLRSYGGDAVNAPPSLTGLINLVYHTLGLNLGGFIPVGLAIIAAVMFAFWLKAAEPKSQSPDRVRYVAALALLGSVLFLVPLHTYDLLLAAPLLLFLPLVDFWKRGITVFSLVPIFVLFRTNNIATATGLTFATETYFPGSSIASIALFILLLASILIVGTEARRTATTCCVRGLKNAQI